jgi:hypothetical protein
MGYDTQFVGSFKLARGLELEARGMSYQDFYKARAVQFYKDNGFRRVRSTLFAAWEGWGRDISTDPRLHTTVKEPMLVQWDNGNWSVEERQAVLAVSTA